MKKIALNILINQVQILALDTTLPGGDVDIVVLDTVLIVFQPDSSQQANGIYEFSSQTNDPSLKPGDIIIGTDGEGYLRFVDSYVFQNEQLTIYTHQATLNDLFDDASFSFDISSDSLETRASGFNYDFDQTVLYQEGPVTLSLTSGSVGLTGNWTGSMEYSLFGGLESFYFGTNNVNLQANFAFNLTASQAVDLLNGSKSLAKFSKPIRVLVGGIPVIITLSAELVGTYELSLSAEAEMDAILSSNLALSTGLSFSDGLWNNTFNVNPTNTVEFTSPEGQVQAVLKLALISQLKMKIYGLVVPYIKPSAHLDVLGTVASPELNWDIKAEAYGKLEYGLEDIVIFGETIATFTPNVHESSHLELYKTPTIIEHVSGNGQIGEANMSLNNPIIVKVKDSFGFSQRNVPVKIEVTLGNGTVSETELTTDVDGLVSTEWILGNDPMQEQELNFIVKDGSGEQISGSPLVVYAVIGAGCGDITSVTDIDGNEYPVVQIGNQCWTKENLKTTKYADGSVIPNITDNPEWAGLSTGAWCNYENSAGNDAVYGKLYNWYTVADPRNVCPAGWHVPTDAEWTTLTDFLGGEPVAGGKMKTTTGWQAPNTGATNESGFSGLPGGYRYGYEGTFNFVGGYGHWWSSSETDGYYAWYRSLFYGLGNAYWYTINRRSGLSVRCLRD